MGEPRKPSDPCMAHVTHPIFVTHLTHDPSTHSLLCPRVSLASVADDAFHSDRRLQVYTIAIQTTVAFKLYDFTNFAGE